jgi:lysophospholipase L1-like esterase
MVSGAKNRPTGRRLLVLLLAGLLLFAGAGALWHFRFNRPIGRAPVPIPVPREAFGRPWSTRPVLLLGLGDSVTAGFGASPGLSYFERLKANPPGEFADIEGISMSAVFPNLTARNASVSGSISGEHEEHIRRLPRQAPEVLGVVVFTTGGNDLIHNNGRTPPREGAMYGATREQARPWIASFEARLGRMLRAVRAKFPGGCRIFLANIYDPTDGTGDAENAGLPRWPDGLAVHNAYNDVIARVAERVPDVYLVDTRGAFLGHGIHCTQFWHPRYRPEDPHYWYYDNLEDPNDRGYDAVRRLFLLKVAEVGRW